MGCSSLSGPEDRAILYVFIIFSQYIHTKDYEGGK